MLAVAEAGSWLNSYIGNRELIAQVHAGASSYNALLGELQRRGPADQDLAATVPPLNALRGIRAGYNERDLAPDLNLTFGLYQGTKLSAAATEAYRKALNDVLLPRLLTLAEKQVAANMGNPDLLYQVLKVYLILSRQGKLDADLVKQWVGANLLAQYPSEEDEANRKALLDHVTVMLEEPLRAIPMNEPLVAQARAMLTREPLAQFSYDRILRSKTVRGVPEWTVAEEGGPEAGRVFELRSGKDLNHGVPGVYTWIGYHTAILPLVATVTQDIAEESWVLGREKRDMQATVRDTAKLRRDVLGLYYNDYVRRWDDMLGDIGVKPYTTTQQALDQLGRLGSPDSPLRDVLESIDSQTQLSRPARTAAAAEAAGSRASRVLNRTTGVARYEARLGLTMRQNEWAGILGEAFGTDPSGKPVDPATRVDDHFRLLHKFVVGEPPRPSPLDQAIERIQAIYRIFHDAAGSPGGAGDLMRMLNNPPPPAPNAPGGAGGGAGAPATGGTDASMTGGPAAQLQELTRSMPPGVAGIMGPVARNATQVAASSAGQEVSTVWRTQVLPTCQLALNRYPFVAGSLEDAPIDDVARVLGPGGDIERFFNAYLKQYVDPIQRPYRWVAQDRVPSGISAASLTRFERAAQIREGLFNNGSAIQVRFTLKPVSMDPVLGQTSVDIGGQTLTYAQGPCNRSRSPGRAATASTSCA